MPDALKDVLMTRGMAPKRDPERSVDEAELQRLMAGNRFIMTDKPVESLLTHPREVMPPPTVGGTPTLARMIRDVIMEFPATRGKVRSVHMGADPAAAGDLERSGFGPAEYSDTNLLGTFDPQRRTMSVNPRFKNPNAARGLDSTLIHEFAHSLGMGEGSAKRVADLYRGRRATDIELKPDPWDDLQQKVTSLLERARAMKQAVESR
jgi:hypothetical protein